jgi:hypothetical protein
MAIIRRPQPALDSVDLASRLAGYEVTRTEGLNAGYASGYSYAAARAAQPSRHSTQIPAPDDAFADRRGAPRYRVHLPVRATPHAEEPWQDGMSVDASLTGLCIEMDRPPDIGFLDVEIDAEVTISAWARVVAWTSLENGRWRWRLRLVSYDAGYPSLFDGLTPIETGFAPPTAEPEAAPREDRNLVTVDGGWGSLLDRPTA